MHACVHIYHLLSIMEVSGVQNNIAVQYIIDSNLEVLQVQCHCGVVCVTVGVAC